MNDVTKSPEFKKWFGRSQTVDKNGKPMVFYHGTAYAGFTEFQGGNTNLSYFTTDPEYANMYTHPSASAIVKTGKQPDRTNPGMYKVFLKIEKLFDPSSNERDRRIFNDEFYMKYGNGAPLDDVRGIPDWTDAEDLIEFFEEKGYDYDGLKLADAHGAMAYAVRDPRQIKSAMGNVKFNPDSPNIIESILHIVREVLNENS